MFKKTHLEIHKTKQINCQIIWQETLRKLIDGLERLGFSVVRETLRGLKNFYSQKPDLWSRWPQRSKMCPGPKVSIVTWRPVTPWRWPEDFPRHWNRYTPVIIITDKDTDEFWDIFIIWKINSGLVWAARQYCEKKSLGPIMSNFWGPFFYVFMGKK